MKRKRTRFTPISKKKRLKKEISSELMNNVKRRTKSKTSGNKNEKNRSNNNNKSLSISPNKNSSPNNKYKQKNYRSISPALANDAKFEITDYDTQLFKKVQQSAETHLSSNTMTPLKTQSPNNKVIIIG